jgi:hypothetical protein
MVESCNEKEKIQHGFYLTLNKNSKIKKKTSRQNSEAYKNLSKVE